MITVKQIRKQKGLKRLFMEMQKRRQFIINFLYFGIIFMLAFVLLKYGLPMVSPFAAGFVIACILRKPVLF